MLTPIRRLPKKTLHRGSSLEDCTPREAPASSALPSFAFGVEPQGRIIFVDKVSVSIFVKLLCRCFT
jgi:hypothetical protein